MTEDGSFESTPGRRSDPRHGEWLLALGEATDAAASLATICFDLARVLGGVPSAEMYHQDLGRLEQRVRNLAVSLGAPPAELVAFLAVLPAARETRNDLMHALRTLYGLHRRVEKPYRIRNFYTVESLQEARLEIAKAHRLGSVAMYHDGGAAVRSWRARGGG